MLTRLKKLHTDEEGLETLQVVAILAVAAIVLATIKYFWTNIRKWADTQINGVATDWEAGN